MQDIMFIGLDVHKAKVSVAVASGERGMNCPSSTGRSTMFTA